MESFLPSPLCQYELERIERIKQNKARLDSMGIKETARDLMASLRPPAQPREYTKPRPRKGQRRPYELRRSRRLSGVIPEYAEARDDPEMATYSDYEPGLDDLLADGDDDNDDDQCAGLSTKPSRAELQQERHEAFQEARCGSLGRGAIYDSAVGITCHFCRQKKLCGEENCPRCSARSTTAECIGKTHCSRCHSATGRFCRACLLIRYGAKLEDVRAQMAAGGWLCPHCYEEEHPEEGWICNSSICMKRRGYKPTGIAIYDAQQRGFASVGHWLQAQLRRRNDAPAAPAAPCGCAAAGSGAAAENALRANDINAAAAGGSAAEAGVVGAAAGAGARGGNGKENVGGRGANKGNVGAQGADKRNEGAVAGGKRGARELAALRAVTARVGAAGVGAADGQEEGGEGPRRSRRRNS